MKVHHTVGADLVNHCVNDIAVQGAAPMFFMDYLATGKLDPEIAEKIVGGLAEACKHNGCALIGGETAEMPGFYPEGEYDLAGFIVGVVERERIITHPPLLCVEVLSPRDTFQAMRKRVQDFFNMGVKDVWIFDPATRIAHACSATTITDHTTGTLRVAGTKIELSIQDVFSTLDA